MPTMMVSRISGYDNNHCVQMPVIQNDPTSHVEYRSEGAYHIRSKNQPHVYWFLPDSTKSTTQSMKRIFLDTRKATKFKMIRDNTSPSAPTADRRVLERRDLVHVVALSPSGNISVGLSNTSVVTTDAHHRFSFGSFYNGDFGVNWGAKEIGPYIIYGVEYAGEEWELV
ncbi:hypothetical protein BJX76DRAFT_342707 [Aspergillus varians]